MAARVIMHVDMDAFFASVEQREQPEFKGKPVIVGADPRGGKGRGVVAACSYQARKFGIHSALPISRAYRLCPHAIYLRPDGALYARVSKAIMEILRRYSDRVEPISIDEAFLDLTGSERLLGRPGAVASHIKKVVRVEQQLTCSIGIAPNKFLAKIASDLNKPDGLLEVAPGTETAFLKDLPVGRIWGVGRKTERRLHRLGVRSIGDVAARPLQFWIERMGRQGEHLWTLSHGVDERPVHSSREFKSLSHETTFLEDTADLERVRKTLLALSEEVTRRSRRHEVAAARVTLKLRYADFTTFTRQSSLPQATNDARSVYGVACKLLDRFLPLQREVRLLGVCLSRFESCRQGREDLFGKQASADSRLNAAIDQITAKFGQASLRKASLLDHPLQEEDRFSSFLKH
ncbi:MAG: DNA polymerase IV [Acidobacteriota bacterium]